MITSLTSGLPSREICLNEPCPWPFTEIDCRSVDAQTPTTALAAMSLEDGLAVTGDIGLRDLEHDRLDRVAGEIVDPAALVAQAGAGQVDRVEDPAE